MCPDHGAYLCVVLTGWPALKVTKLKYSRRPIGPKEDRHTKIEGVDAQI